MNQNIAERAGELHWKYEVPTVDSLIAATGIAENVKHVLTSDKRHFGNIKNFIKITNLQRTLELAK